MKYIILAVFGAGLVFGSAYYITRARTVSITPQGDEMPGAAAAPTSSTTQESGPGHVSRPLSESPTPPTPTPQEKSASVIPMQKAAISQAVDVLVSLEATHGQKQAAWKQLREGGGLDGAIADLQQRVADNPANADYAAVLGQACLQKCGTISDLRDQGMLAMQADKLFDTALTLDPQNWEARFTKAVALSYWPASMGKSEEVIQHFLFLVQQQETHPPQPQFAETYLWLGDQYQKAGRNDDARSVWTRGSTFYPSDEKLSGRLAAVR